MHRTFKTEKTDEKPSLIPEFFSVGRTLGRCTASYVATKKSNTDHWRGTWASKVAPCPCHLKLTLEGNKYFPGITREENCYSEFKSAVSLH